MTLSLRERRRLETARHIQMKTLELAIQSSLENVTTEEISVAAGISTRTFFNYYTNKEAAAVGAPPPFRKEALTTLEESNGPLADDIKSFLNQHIKLMTGDEPILNVIGKVMRPNEKVRGIMEEFLASQRQDLAASLEKRLNDRHAATALASSVTDIIRRAIFVWEHTEQMSLNAALDIVWEGLITASTLLTTSPPRA